MAIRPVFSVSLNNKIFIHEDVNFEWFSGFSTMQKRRSINSLHQNFLLKHPEKKILEISSKSEIELGVKLSAFNLKLHRNGKIFSVETAFQSGKIFENGGPYLDLLDKSSIVAKKDERLKNSGKIKGFIFEDKRFPITPKTYFYNWLYINALSENIELAEQIMAYDSFTDIVFNPIKSINCQAMSAAIFVSLKKQNLLNKTLNDNITFLKILYQKNDFKV